MCVTTKHIYTICAHTSVSVREECPEFTSRLDKSQRFFCDRICVHSQAISPSYGFCPSCENFFSSGPFPWYSETLIRNYWCYKASRKWHVAVDASRVPRQDVFQPAPEDGHWKSTRIVTEGKAGGKRRKYQVCYEEMSLMDAVGRQDDFSEQCAQCRANPRQRDLKLFATSARNATLNWARVGEAGLLPARDRADGQPHIPEPEDEEKDVRLEELLSRIILDEDQGSLQRRFSHPDLVPAPLRPTSADKTPPQQRAPSLGSESIDWLDKSL